jgi:DNA-binding PucR family transcriptional regulator
METTLAQVLAALGEPLVDVVVAPRGLDVPVTGVAIVDPDDDPADHPRRLVLVIGARGRDAVRPLRAAARHGAAAVAVKTGGAGAELGAAAVDAGVALLAVRPDARWEHLERLVHTVLHEGEATADGDLYSLAQTLGRLTGGLVSIEDTTSRVLAYSRSDSGEPDELRRLSILGWQGPADYLARLRSWGVYDRLRESEDVVRVDEHPALGIRRRLAAGIHAGRRQLGTIWVQEGDGPLAASADAVLLGAARVAAGHLVRRRAEAAPGARLGRDVVTGLLDGRVAADLAAAAFGIDAAAPAVVVAFGVPGGDATARELAAGELAAVVALHAAAFRREALVAASAGRVYAVLPGVRPRARDEVPAAVRSLCAEIATAAGRRAGARVQAGIGSVVPGLAGVPSSRADADRVLDAVPPDAHVAAIADLRAEILLDAALAALRDLDDPVAAALLEHDRAHGSELARSVLALLDALGDVAGAARRLTVHPNTLRHRLRRAADVAGVDLEDPASRTVLHLHLLRELRPRAGGGAR